MVEGILVVWKAALFAGRRRNEGLGRSVVGSGFLSLSRRAGDSGCPEVCRGGERRRAYALQACAPAQAREIVACAPVDASFARSFDPCASILTMHGTPKNVFVVGRALRHHGWANPLRVGGTNTGAGPFGRSAARRVSPLSQGRQRGTSEKEGGRGLRPCEDQESRLVVRTSCLLQKSAGDLWSRISSAHALQKERSGSSERGPSLELESAGDTVGWGAWRRERRESASPPMTGEVRRKAQGGARASSSGRDIAKSGGAVVGPGL